MKIFNISITYTHCVISSFFDAITFVFWCLIHRGHNQFGKLMHQKLWICKNNYLEIQLTRLCFHFSNFKDRNLYSSVRLEVRPQFLRFRSNKWRNVLLILFYYFREIKALSLILENMKINLNCLYIWKK